MVAYRLLNSSGIKSHTVYFVNNPCPLQDIFHPMPNFDGKIKGVYKHTEDKDKHILELATEIQDESNHHLNALCKELFNINPKKHYFQLKQEVIAKSKGKVKIEE